MFVLYKRTIRKKVLNVVIVFHPLYHCQDNIYALVATSLTCLCGRVSTRKQKLHKLAEISDGLIIFLV